MKQEPGKAEAEIAKIGGAQVLRTVLTYRGTGPPVISKEGFGHNPNGPQPLPSWLSEEDLAYYASKFDKSGFTGPLNYYRNMNQNWELTAAWTGAKVKVPVKFITGEVDMVYTTPMINEHINGGGFKKDVPNLEEVVVQAGVGHFNNQEAAEEISNHIYDFITKF
ncbi:epoxide hydrolase [Senna tora]|uniref:Epoxide hydrolase n=1 Tax=Senna tora TaxID=362788 RepID=A0A834TMX2_9FABA|nr:epoxide hydrolase [Senna tora]